MRLQSRHPPNSTFPLVFSLISSTRRVSYHDGDCSGHRLENDPKKLSYLYSTIPDHICETRNMPHTVRNQRQKISNYLHDISAIYKHPLLLHLIKITTQHITNHTINNPSSIKRRTLHRRPIRNLAPRHRLIIAETSILVIRLSKTILLHLQESLQLAPPVVAVATFWETETRG